MSKRRSCRKSCPFSSKGDYSSSSDEEEQTKATHGFGKRCSFRQSSSDSSTCDSSTSIFRERSWDDFSDKDECTARVKRNERNLSSVTLAGKRLDYDQRVRGLQEEDELVLQAAQCHAQVVRLTSVTDIPESTHLQVVRAIGRTFVVRKQRGFQRRQQAICFFPGANLVGLLQRVTQGLQRSPNTSTQVDPNRVKMHLGSDGFVKARKFFGYETEGLLVHLDWLSVCVGQPVMMPELRQVMFHHPSLRPIAVPCLDLIADYVLSAEDDTDVSKLLRVCDRSLLSDQLIEFEAWSHGPVHKPLYIFNNYHDIQKMS